VVAFSRHASALAYSRSQSQVAQPDQVVNRAREGEYPIHFEQSAFYYVRVIQIPSPRQTAYDQKRFGIKMADNVQMTVTDRAYTSPVWYSSGK